jgi:hypothetical protein
MEKIDDFTRKQTKRQEKIIDYRKNTRFKVTTLIKELYYKIDQKPKKS